jgi:hypothetical protein
MVSGHTVQATKTPPWRVMRKLCFQTISDWCNNWNHRIEYGYSSQLEIMSCNFPMGVRLCQEQSSIEQFRRYGCKSFSPPHVLPSMEEVGWCLLFNFQFWRICFVSRYHGDLLEAARSPVGVLPYGRFRIDFEQHGGSYYGGMDHQESRGRRNSKIVEFAIDLPKGCYVVY